MEEILASIKRIIAEDSDAKASAPARPRSLASKAAAKSPAASEQVDDQILELTEPAMDEESSDEMLLSESNEAAMRNSLSALTTLSEPGIAPQIVRSGETSLEGMVREMLRPMMKDWLDQNLPTLVEEMVAKEISRITRKG